MLLDLPFEVLIRIFILSPHYSYARRFGLTCTTLWRYYQSREHWIGQIRALSRKMAPDLPPHVDVSTLTTARIRTLFRRAINAYVFFKKRWPRSNLYHDFHLPFSRDVVVDVTKSDMKSTPELLPGGRFILAEVLIEEDEEDEDADIATDLRLFDLANEGRFVWSFNRDMPVELVLDVQKQRVVCWTKAENCVGMFVYYKNSYAVYDLLIDDNGEVLREELLHRTTDYNVPKCRKPRGDGDFIVFFEDDDGSPELCESFVVENVACGWRIRIIDIFDLNKFKLVNIRVQNGYFFVLAFVVPGGYTLYVVSLDALGTYAQGHSLPCSISFQDIFCSSFCLSSSVPPGFALGRPHSLDICDYSWTGLKQPLMITVFAQAAKVDDDGNIIKHKFSRHGRCYILAYEIKLNSSTGLNSSPMLTLHNVTQPMPHLDEEWDEGGTTLRAFGATRSAQCTFYMTDIADMLRGGGLFGNGRQFMATYAIDEDGSLHKREEMYPRGYSFKYDLIDVERYSGALVYKSTSLSPERIRIAYP